MSLKGGMPTPLSLRVVGRREHGYNWWEKRKACARAFAIISPVGISGHIFVDTLHPNLQPCTAIGQHVT